MAQRLPNGAVAAHELEANETYQALRGAASDAERVRLLEDFAVAADSERSTVQWSYKREKDGTINCYFGRRRGSKNGHVYADIVPSIGKSDSGDRQRAQLFAGNILIVILTSECLPRRPQAQQQRDEAKVANEIGRYNGVEAQSDNGRGHQYAEETEILAHQYRGSCSLAPSTAGEKEG